MGGYVGGDGEMEIVIRLSEFYCAKSNLQCCGLDFIISEAMFGLQDEQAINPAIANCHAPTNCNSILEFSRQIGPLNLSHMVLDCPRRADESFLF